eukprot:Em0018g95a
MSCFGGDLPDDEREALKQQKRHQKEIDAQLRQDKIAYKATHRLLLLGAGESGKSTIVKQMKILHKDGYSDQERYEKVKDIRSNIRDSIVSVIEAMDKLQPRVQISDAENVPRAQYVRDVVSQKTFDSFSPEFFSTVSILWKDAGVQAMLERSNEYQLIDSAAYFMHEHKLAEISRPDYKPDDQDILRCRVLTNGIFETKFVVEKVNFHMFDVGGQRSERRKWIQCFNDVTAIVFVVSCSSFDTVIREDGKTRVEPVDVGCLEGGACGCGLCRGVEPVDVGCQRVEPVDVGCRVEPVDVGCVEGGACGCGLCRGVEPVDVGCLEGGACGWLQSVSVILFLNKQDTLRKKVEAGKRVEDYFPEFAAYRAPTQEGRDKGEVGERESELYTRAKYFVRDLFVRISKATESDPRHPHYLYPHFTTAIDTENIKRVFNSCRDIIQREHLRKYELL